MLHRPTYAWGGSKRSSLDAVVDRRDQNSNTIPINESSASVWLAMCEMFTEPPPASLRVSKIFSSTAVLIAGNRAG